MKFKFENDICVLEPRLGQGIESAAWDAYQCLAEYRKTVRFALNGIEVTLRNIEDADGGSE